MKQPAPSTECQESPAGTESESTGLPGFQNWSSIYWLVTSIFAVVVGLLMLLTRLYS